VACWLLAQRSDRGGAAVGCVVIAEPLRLRFPSCARRVRRAESIAPRLLVFYNASHGVFQGLSFRRWSETPALFKACRRTATIARLRPVQFPSRRRHLTLKKH